MVDAVERCALYLDTLLRVVRPEIRTASVEEVIPDADDDVDLARLERALEQAHRDWNEPAPLDGTDIEGEVWFIDAPVTSLSAKCERC